MNVNEESVRVNKSLFNIRHEYLNILERIEENEGELIEELEELLIKSDEEFKKKAISYIGIITDKKAHLSTIDDEIKRLQAVKKATNSSIERLSDNLLTALLEFGYNDKGIFRYEVDTFRLSTRKSNPCIFPDEDKIGRSLISKLMGADEATLSKLEEGELSLDLDIVDANKDIDDEDNIIKSNSPLNEVEVDYIQNNLTYDVKFHSTYSEMMRVLMYAKNVISNPYLNIVADVKLPNKEASTIIKDKGGFRLARVDTKYSLTIK